MSEEGKLPEIVNAQASEPMSQQEVEGGNHRDLQSANSFNNQRASHSQPAGGKTAFIAKKERQE